MICPYSLDAEPSETVEVILSDGTRRSILKEALYLRYAVSSGALLHPDV
jgi:hypothetical protein